MRRLFLIDGSSFCYRAFYAVRELSTSTGQPTHAVYGVASMVKKLLEEERPDYVGVAFDTPKPTFRHERFKAYKIHRPPMPDGLAAQMDSIKELFRAYRIPIFERAGYEADDILGTLARRASAEGLQVFLVTGDKDAYQLLGDRVRIYRPIRDGHELLDPETLKERWELSPAQVVDVMALMGDPVDGIPGVKGIGEKTAVALIQRFGSVERLLQAAGKVPGIRPSVLEAVRREKQTIVLSRELATIDTAVPLEFGLEHLKAVEPDRKRLADLFRKLEFRSLLKELEPEQAARQVRMEPVPSGPKRKAWIERIRRAGRFSLCRIAGAEPSPQPSASKGKGPWGQASCGFAFCFEAGTAWIAAGAEDWEAIREPAEDPTLLKICPDLKGTLLELWRRQARLEPPWTDPLLAAYLLQPGRTSPEMPVLSAELLGVSLKAGDPVARAAAEAAAAFEIMPRLEKEVREKSLEPLLKEVEVPLAAVLARMEARGVAVDRKVFDSLSRQIGGALEKLTGEIHRIAGEPFNINSSKQLGGVLFERLGLPVVKRTKTGPSTDEEVLRRLAPSHALARKVLEYRELAKLSSTYVEALPKLIDEKTGRIHASFNQTVTATGRLSSSNPNLQNIPVRTEWGRRIREAFVPSQRGAVFLAADYSQIELRLLAHLSGDEGLLAAFRQGQDIHRRTAARVFGVSPEKVEPEQRSAAKVINFGIVYGMTGWGLAKELGVLPEQAEAFIRDYFERYPGVRRYLTETIEQARRVGYCTTLFGRRRYIPEIRAREAAVRQFAERTAVNAPIQGSAADLIKAAMVAIDAALAESGLPARMILQVHDELIFETAAGSAEKLKALVREKMERPVFAGEPLSLRVPIQVNIEIGRNWLEASHG